MNTSFLPGYILEFYNILIDPRWRANWWRRDCGFRIEWLPGLTIRYYYSMGGGATLAAGVISQVCPILYPNNFFSVVITENNSVGWNYSGVTVYGQSNSTKEMLKGYGAFVRNGGAVEFFSGLSYQHLLSEQTRGNTIIFDESTKKPIAVTPVPASETQLAEAARRQRDNLLFASDWTQVPDAPVDQQAWRSYRAVLRQVPEQTGFSHNVEWPVSPGK